MTYGWAILIIAVVLGALYSLGVFNMSAYMPKIGPGACHVFRPNGPGTSWNVALTGSCAGYLPQYVAQFNGQSSSISLQNQISQEAGTSPMSFSAWFYESTSSASYPTIFGDTVGSPRIGYDLHIRPGQILGAERFYGGTQNYVFSTSNTISLNRWYFGVITYDGSSLRLYLNNILIGSVGATASITLDSIMSIGASSGTSYYFPGSIANVQIYNTSLTANQIQYLYNEGIGGAPIYLQYLVGWWPLNGDTLDYSGNNNNGVPTAIAYNGSWTSGYYH